MRLTPKGARVGNLHVVWVMHIHEKLGKNKNAGYLYSLTNRLFNSMFSFVWESKGIGK